ncbi:MAG: DUF3300 domain-containing protein [Terracidiphilus sp.]|jgi:hypothetical protein
MKPLSDLHLQHNPLFSRNLPVTLLSLLLALLPGRVLAQQGWPQNPQYAYGQTAPYPNQYAPSQQPYSQQQTYAQPSPYAQQPYPAIDDEPNQSYSQGYPQQGYAQPLSADQLEQLVAPIALYPDALVAQMLAAATYPAQVVGADHWLQSQAYLPAGQISYAADAQPWDPSVKALTAFPRVLAQMDRDIAWTTDLGNAYYNQPQDVLQTVQVMRERAEAAGTLESTPQEAVSYNQGYIELAPPDPQVVYVPAYNPWDVYGQPVQPYPGFSLLGSLQSLAGSAPVRFGLGIAMSAFSHSPFGWAGWALNWLTQSVLFHQSNYTSHSTSVAHWASPRGGSSFASRGGPISRQPGSPYRPQQGFANSYAGDRAYTANRSYESPNRGYAGNNLRPALPTYAYNRPQPQVMPARPQPYARPGGYGSSFYGNSTQAYAARPAAPYASPQQSFRAPASNYQRNNYAQRSYQVANNRGYAESFAKPEKSGGFHLFGSHNQDRSYGSYKALRYKAPKGFKEPKEHSHGGGHSGGHGHRF